MVPFLVLSKIRHLVFRGPKRGPYTIRLLGDPKPESGTKTGYIPYPQLYRRGMGAQVHRPKRRRKKSKRPLAFGGARKNRAAKGLSTKKIMILVYRHLLLPLGQVFLRDFHPLDVRVCACVERVRG